LIYAGGIAYAAKGGKAHIRLAPRAHLPHISKQERQMQELEEQIAHLTRTVEDMSDVVARQEREIVVLTRRVQMLMQREGAREAEGGGGVITGDERPPHY